MNNALPLDSLLTYFDLSKNAIGSSRWWNDLSKSKAPFTKVQQNGTCRVLFIWQDPEGGKHSSTTSSVILNVNGLTNHNTWQPNCLNRYNDSALWFACLDINDKWRGSYSFIPIQANQLPQLVKQGDESREAQRCWWLEMVKQQVLDPLNSGPSVASGWGLNSSLHLPNAPRELGWQEWDQGKLNNLPIAANVNITWFADQLDNQRQCTVFSTATGKAPLVILLDGEKWGADSGMLSVLQYLTNINKIVPAHYLLIPSIDSKTRWQELSCSALFWQAVTEQLLPRVTDRLLQSEKSISEFILAGQSLGGLSAVYAGIHFQTYFTKVISLSGSFWWPEVERMQDPDAYKSAHPEWKKIVPKNSLADRVSNNEVSVAGLHIYQTVGNAETQLSVYNDLHYEIFKQHGAKITYQKVDGGHDWLSWRSSLINGLISLLPSQV
ncbi:enterochelin esterase [Psychromonas arctica]|uniref:enterochelin esterase n=1 Tax=Psychromonas arctica TaxID=168275 RepID=UPI00041AC04A|nr:enterochelin esterase [Psychromonas arctica]